MTSSEEKSSQADTVRAREDVENNSKSPAQAQIKDIFEAAAEEAKKNVPAVWNKDISLGDDRQRAFTALLYPESMADDAMGMLERAGLMGCISPLHNQDRYPDGTVKKAHYHMLVYFPGKTSLKNVTALLSQIGAVRVQPVANIVGMVRYFCHLDIDPENVPGDVGKVRYSVEKMWSFGGFDAMSYVKATPTARTKALRELYKLIEQMDFTAYCEFITYVYLKQPEYEYLLADASTCTMIDRFIRSRYALRHSKCKEQLLVERDAQIEELREIVNTQSQLVAKLMTATNSVLKGLSNGRQL